MEEKNTDRVGEEIRLDVIKDAVKAGGGEKKRSARAAREENRRLARATVLSAMMSALSLVILWIGYASNIADLTAVTVTAVIIVIVQLEFGSPWYQLTGAATTLLAFLLIPNKLLSIIYLCFGVGFPILKRVMRRTPYLVGLILRLVYCNLIMTGIIALAKFVFMLPEDEYGFSVLIYIIANVIFICSDFFIDAVTVEYFRKIKPRFSRIFKK